MLVVKGKREAIFSLNAPRETDVLLLVKPSRAVFAHLLSNTSVRVIRCPPGVYATIPRKVIEALSDGGVEVKELARGRGRPRKLSAVKLEVAKGLAQKVGAKAALLRSGIAKSTYYYRLRRERMGLV
jgi:hypothetical protein